MYIMFHRSVEVAKTPISAVFRGTHFTGDLSAFFDSPLHLIREYEIRRLHEANF